MVYVYTLVTLARRFPFMALYEQVWDVIYIHFLFIIFQDLARSFVDVLGNEKASKQVFNISGEKYVTFDGLARACAKVDLAEYLLTDQNLCSSGRA